MKFAKAAHTVFRAERERKCGKIFKIVLIFYQVDIVVRVFARIGIECRNMCSGEKVRG